jgi:hypothetical protein
VNVVVDSSRQPNLLYSISRKHVVNVYSLGERGDQMVWQARNNRVRYEALVLLGGGVARAPSVDWDEKEFQIVSLSVVPRTEADAVCLVAVTEHGHRIYFHLEQSKTNLASVACIPCHLYQCLHMCDI